MKTTFQKNISPSNLGLNSKRGRSQHEQIAGFWLGLLFFLEDEGDMFVLNTS
jgi:hypothetical protein